MGKDKLTIGNVALFSFGVMLALAFFVLGVGRIGTGIAFAYSIVGLGIWASYRLLLKYYRAETARNRGWSPASAGRAPTSLA